MGDVRYLVLGALRVLRGERAVELRAAKPRRLLATLLLHPNRFVSTDLITDVLWEDRPPRSAIANIRTYVRAVRDALGEPAPIQTHHGGYSIAVDDDDLDACRLERWVERARQSRRDGDAVAALRHYDQGRALWRGRPLEDLELAGAWAGAIGHLEQLYRAATDEVVSLRLLVGDHTEAAGLIRRRLADDPYDEDLWAHLVRCQLAAGHQQEAMATYADAVRTLADELGVEPGEALRAAGASVAEPADQPAPRLDVTSPAHRIVPSQLPLDVPDLVGRDDEAARLRELFDGAARDRPPVAVISGAPGTGKTALAVHVAHRVAHLFGDGQVYLDLRAAGRPRDPAGALLELLRSLGVADSAIPQDADRRAAALRSELAARRVLVLLDDAYSAAQVIPLLPGTGTSGLLVTSRRRLTDLHGAMPVHLDVLGQAPAAELLRRIAGTGRVDPHDSAAAEIVRACGNLPLAIRIAAGRLVQRGDLSPAALARRLHDERHRLDELSIGDLAVRSSADLSYRALNPAEARVYRLIGMLGTSEFAGWTIAHAAGGGSVDLCMDRLIEANLVQVTTVDTTGASAYRVHDLLRLHAKELATGTARRQSRDDLDVVLDSWLGHSKAAVDRLPYRYFGVQDTARASRVPTTEVPAGPDAAIGWLEAHQQSLVPMVRAAAEQELHDHAWRLAVAWAPYFDLRGPFEDDWRVAHETALISAMTCGARRGAAIIQRDLGQLAVYRDDWATAHRSFTESLHAFRDLDDRTGVGVASVGLGTWHREQGMTEQAMPWYESALAAFLAAGDLHGEAVARNAIASIRLRHHDLDGAEGWLARAHSLTVRTGDEHREAQVLCRLAALRTMRGEHAAAVTDLRAALAIFERLQDARCVGTTHVSLGDALLSRGDRVSARRVLLHVLTAGVRLGDRTIEAQAAARLGQLHQDAGRADSAREYLTRALRAWQVIANHQRSEEVRQRLSTLSSV